MEYEQAETKENEINSSNLRQNEQTEQEKRQSGAEWRRAEVLDTVSPMPWKARNQRWK
jgi:hypothetical protein